MRLHTTVLLAALAAASTASVAQTSITKSSGTIATCDASSGTGVPRENCSVSTGSMAITIQAPPSPRYIGFSGLTTQGLRAPTVKGTERTLPTNKNLRGDSGVTFSFCIYDTGGGNVLFQVVNADDPKGNYTFKSNATNTEMKVRLGFRLPDGSLSGYGVNAFARTIPSGTLPTASTGCGGYKDVFLDVGLPPEGMPQNGEQYELVFMLHATPL